MGILYGNHHFIVVRFYWSNNPVVTVPPKHRILRRSWKKKTNLTIRWDGTAVSLVLPPGRLVDGVLYRVTVLSARTDLVRSNNWVLLTARRTDVARTPILFDACFSSLICTGHKMYYQCGECEKKNSPLATISKGTYKTFVVE